MGKTLVVAVVVALLSGCVGRGRGGGGDDDDAGGGAECADLFMVHTQRCDDIIRELVLATTCGETGFPDEDELRTWCEGACELGEVRCHSWSDSTVSMDECPASCPAILDSGCTAVCTE